MIKTKRIKRLLLSTCLVLGVSCSISVNTYADEPAAYTVVSGDSLFKIGQFFGTTVEDLMSDNHLQSIGLDIGQVLAVPCSTYTVQKGDTLYLISQKYKMPLETLRRANHIYTDYLDIGQILNIPGTSTTYVSNNFTTAFVPETSYSASDLDLLARLVHAEAQGESYDVKVAVGAVVLNRMKSGLFPDTVGEVIYQNINGYYQFTPVVNGWINKPAGADSIKAAKAAFSGTDPTNGALFYYDSGTTNQWILAKPVSIRIGSMVFAY